MRGTDPRRGLLPEQPPGPADGLLPETAQVAKDQDGVPPEEIAGTEPPALEGARREQHNDSLVARRAMLWGCRDCSAWRRRTMSSASFGRRGLPGTQTGHISLLSICTCGLMIGHRAGPIRPGGQSSMPSGHGSPAYRPPATVTFPSCPRASQPKLCPCRHRQRRAADPAAAP